MQQPLTFKDYFIAVRPWTYPASLAPGLIAFLYVLTTKPMDVFHIFLGILAVLSVIILHAGGNYISDYHDYVNGIDREGFFCNPPLVSGQFTPKQILSAGLVCVCVGVCIGSYILFHSGAGIFLFAIIGIGGTFGYYRFKYVALGDVLIFIVFGPAATMGVGYAMTGVMDWNLFFVSLPVAFITTNILHANNARDIEGDTEVNIVTLAMSIGIKGSVFLYILLLVFAYTSLVALVIAHVFSVFSLLPLVTIPFAVRNCQAMYQKLVNSETCINTLDVATVQLHIIFTGLLAFSLFLTFIF